MEANGIRPGSVLLHYELIRLLGRGGMGQVFLARDTRLGRLVAIKLLARRSASQQEHVQRFLIEAHATAQLNHENIIVIYDLGEHNGAPFMVLEYLKGKTLQDRLRGRMHRGQADALEDTGDEVGVELHQGAAVGLSADHAVELMIPVVRALVRAHEHGIVHRDLKPSNIMVMDTGTVKVLDFGIAKLLPAPAEAPPAKVRGAQESDERARLLDGGGMTETGQMLGTKPYMSPEQWSLDQVDHRTDIWAVGVILAELLLGHHPLAPLSLFSLATVSRLDVPMPSLRKILPELGKLGSIVDRCLIKPVEDRMGSALELLAELEAVAPGAKRASTAGRVEDAHSPYPGLSAFQTEDAGRFFGRARAVAEAVAQLGEQPLLAIVAPSGAGKSSFVRAGVIPALEHSGDTWTAFTVRPGAHPVAALAELLLDETFHTSTLDLLDRARKKEPFVQDREGLAKKLREEPGLLGARMRSFARSKRMRLLLFIDQAEELYTLAGEEDRAAFFACLLGVADDVGSPLRAVLAIRSDFLDRMADVGAASAALRRGILLLPAMDRDGLREALMRPLSEVDHRIESPELVEEILDALEKTTAPLPLLSFTASRLWEQRDRAQRTLTEASYRQTGGIGGALAGHADAVLGAMSDAERKLTRAALLRLITPERTRAVTAMRELRELGGAPEIMERVLARLIDARLLTVEGGESEATVELVHESLIDGWPALAGWMAENQADAVYLARLRHAAREWESGGSPDDLLWRGRLAEDATRWYNEYSGELSPSEKRYIEAVIALSGRARRARRAIVVGVFAALTAVAVIVSILAIVANQSAAEKERALVQAKLAEQQARDRAVEASDARLLAGFRELKTREQLAWGEKLLAEVQRPGAARGWTALASEAVASNTLFATLRGHDKAARSAVWSHDGKRVVSASDDGTARVWNTDGTGDPVVLAGHKMPVLFAMFSPDDQRVLTTSVDGTARIHNVSGAGTVIVLAAHASADCPPAWSPDGRRVVIASDPVRVWNSDGAGEVDLEGHTAPIVAVAFLPDGERVLTASADGAVRVFRADGTGAADVFKGPKGSLTFAALSPDGTRFITTSTDAKARIWNLSSKASPIVLAGHTAAVSWAAWSPDSKYVATASTDQTARVWRADGKGQPVILSGHGGAVTRVAFRPDGRYVVTASLDQTARIWPTPGGAALILRGHEAPVSSADWSSDGARLLTAGAPGDEVRIWRPTQLEALPREREAFCHSAFIGTGGDVVASACDDRAVRLSRIDGSGEPRIFKDHADWVTNAAMTPDGKSLVTMSLDRTARIVPVDGGGDPVVISLRAAARTAAVSPDSKRVALGSDDGTAYVYPADGKGDLLLLRGHTDALTSIAWSPDGSRVVTASLDHTARVFRVGAAGEPVVLAGHGGGVATAAWSADGTRIVTASEDGTARVWNAETGVRLSWLDGGSAVLRAIFDPGGERIAIAPLKGGLRLGNADGSGEPTVLDTPAPVLAMAFVDGGKSIVAVLEDNTTRTFTIDTALLTRELAASNADCLPPRLRVTYLDELPDAAQNSYAKCEIQHHRTPQSSEGKEQ